MNLVNLLEMTFVLIQLYCTTIKASKIFLNIIWEKIPQIDKNLSLGIRVEQDDVTEEIEEILEMEETEAQ